MVIRKIIVVVDQISCIRIGFYGNRQRIQPCGGNVAVSRNKSTFLCQEGITRLVKHQPVQEIFGSLTLFVGSIL